MSSQHRYTNRNYRPADEEYEPVRAAIEADGFTMNALVRGFLRWLTEDLSRLRQLTPYMKAVTDETPRGRPKRSAPTE